MAKKFYAVKKVVYRYRYGHRDLKWTREKRIALLKGIYMDMDMGTAPYDAIPIIISKYVKRFSFRTIRMVFDFTVVVNGGVWRDNLLWNYRG